MKRLFLILALAVATLSANAKIKLPSVISDNMVLQQRSNAAIWGTARPGAKVTVVGNWKGCRKVTATADPQSGKWLVRIATPAAGGPYSITISDGEAVKLNNILIGEVWFCSGQSNMSMPMKGFPAQPIEGATGIITNAKDSRNIRICTVKNKSSVSALDESVGSWQCNTPEVVAKTSAIAYMFADVLQNALDVPVGIIITSWGGSTIEAWIRRDYLEKNFAGEFNLDHLDGKVKPKTKHKEPCVLFNGQVNPLIPFTFKGMIWYQGESNRSRAEQYTRLQKNYVEMMRTLFEVPDAAFYYVQIAPYNYSSPDHFKSGYFYEAQEKCLDVIPNSGMATSCDLGEINTIHPCRKYQISQRLAWLALQHTYSMKGFVADPPRYKSVKFEDGKAYVDFTGDPLGLSPMNKKLTGFEIAGEDKVFHPATAKAYNKKKFENTVVVSCPEVSNPVAVRYCFRNWSKGTIFNNYGIPACPFRTDNWDDLEK